MRRKPFSAKPKFGLSAGGGTLIMKCEPRPTTASHFPQRLDAESKTWPACQNHASPGFWMEMSLSQGT